MKQQSIHLFSRQFLHVNFSLNLTSFCSNTKIQFRLTAVWTLSACKCAVRRSLHWKPSVSHKDSVERGPGTNNKPLFAYLNWKEGTIERILHYVDDCDIPDCY